MTKTMEYYYDFYKTMQREYNKLIRKGDIDAAEAYYDNNGKETQKEFINSGSDFITLYYMYEWHRDHKSDIMVIDYAYKDFKEVVKYLKESNVTNFAIPKDYVERYHRIDNPECDECEQCMDYSCEIFTESLDEPWYLEEEEVNNLIENIKDAGCIVTGTQKVNAVLKDNVEAITFRIL